jgi:hypothetical protein
MPERVRLLLFQTAKRPDSILRAQNDGAAGPRSQVRAEPQVERPRWLRQLHPLQRRRKSGTNAIKLFCPCGLDNKHVMSVI